MLGETPTPHRLTGHIAALGVVALPEDEEMIELLAWRARQPDAGYTCSRLPFGRTAQGSCAGRDGGELESLDGVVLLLSERMAMHACLGTMLAAAVARGKPVLAVRVGDGEMTEIMLAGRTPLVEWTWANLKTFIDELVPNHAA